MYEEPNNSPWGKVQNWNYLCPGVYSVSTAGHGSIMAVADAAKIIFSTSALECAFRYEGFFCFEEDCDAPIALRELLDKNLITAPVNDYFKQGEYSDAIDRSLQEWHPEYWKARQKSMEKTVRSATSKPTRERG
ncbi:DUF7007 domain-containing protein [Anaerotruncus rubiinfantis]|uniref:DUF7007 domain-containing protein n=1 Tax=Anaerotruncus rubiinfantis TaxID=1720200 RepID=UPI0034A2C306